MLKERKKVGIIVIKKKWKKDPFEGCQIWLGL